MCEQCKKLLMCAYGMRGLSQTMAICGKVLIMDKGNDFQFFYSESAESVPYELHRCPECNADIQAMLHNEKDSKDRIVALGDLSQEEMNEICKQYETNASDDKKTPKHECCRCPLYKFDKCLKTELVYLEMELKELRKLQIRLKV